MSRFSLLLVLCFFFSLCCGQIKDDFILEKIESLNKIQVSSTKYIKPKERTFIIRVRSQKDFDVVNEKIDEAISAGNKNIIIKIRRGVYHFHENHIQRKSDDFGDVSISIIGRRAVITSDDDYCNSELENPWVDLVQADSLIVVVDEKQKLCFIPYKNNINAKRYIDFSKVKITQWYMCPSYQIHHIDGDGIYFIAKTLDYKKEFGRENYTLNYDYLYHGDIPRFSMYDSTKKRKCTSTCFLRLKNCKYKSFKIEGLKFGGNKSGDALITLNGCSFEQLSISKCIFEYIRSKVLYVIATDNVVFDANSLHNTYGDELSFVQGCNKVFITHNLFDNCGLSFRQTFCVNCGEADYYIGDNIFRDFGYAAIGVGIWYGHEKTKPSCGIIENNEIYFTSSYFSDCLKHMLMDSGAIYTWTKTNKVIIRNNFIHDYIGAADNRGIFCDDGSSNLQIYDNVVLNIPNCYCIDSRREIDQNADVHNNSNNFMAHNIVDGSVRFMGYGDENRNCVKGANIVLKKNNRCNNLYFNVFDGLDWLEDDIIVDAGLNKMLLNRDSRILLKKI